MGKSLKLAILIPGALPVPTVKGGAVEMLTEYLLRYNEEKLHHQITLFGIADEKITQAQLAQYNYCRFELLNQQSFSARMKRLIYSKTAKRTYYHHYLDYFAYQAFQQIKKEQYDLILIENRPNFVLFAANELKNLPVLLHLHNDTLNPQATNAKEIVEKADKILTVSNYIKNQIDSIGILNKTQAVYNGIDLDKFNPAHITPAKREELGLSPSDFVVIFSGRLDPIKGIKELLKAFLLLNQYNDIKLLVIGGSNYGNSEENDFVKEMKSMVEQLKDRVVFTGHLPYESIPSILPMGDIAVIPSICEEALSLAAIECLACGLPIVVTRSGGLPETTDENCAFVIEKDNDLVKNLAEKMLLLYQDKEKRAAMSQAAKERAKFFDKGKYNQEIFAVIEEVASN